MNPEISPVEPLDFDAIYTKYLEFDDPRLGRAEWQRLFCTRCRASSASPCGYKMTDRGQLVGMLGTVFSQRQIDGRMVPFCNLHSWFVDERFRGYSLLLMRPILGLTDHVITDFTPTPPVVRISLRLGFNRLNIPERMLPFFAPRKQSVNSELTWDDEIDPQALSDADRILNEEHRGRGFRQLVVRSGRDISLVIMRRNTFHWRSYASILYVSNPELMVAAQASWQTEIRQRLNVCNIVGPEKYLPRQLIRSLPIPFRNHRLYRGPKHFMNRIDMLYSEVSELGLTTLPGIRYFGRLGLSVMNPVHWIRRNFSV